MAKLIGDKDIAVVEMDYIGEEVFVKCKNLKIIGCCRGNPVNINFEAANYYVYLFLIPLAVML